MRFGFGVVLVGFLGVIGGSVGKRVLFWILGLLRGF